MAPLINRYRGRMILGNALVDLPQELQIPQLTKNITDNYDPERLARETVYVQYKVEHDGPEPSKEDIATSIISMRDAITFSANDDYKTRTDLSDNQKKLVETVRNVRASDAGKKISDEAAIADRWLIIDNNIPKKAGYFDDLENLGLIGLRLSDILDVNYAKNVTSKELKRSLHHEDVHSHQAVFTPMPDGLTSYDQRLWCLGQEGQAFVAEEDERRRDEQKLPLTDKEKRETFSKLLNNGISQERYYAEHYDLMFSDRKDGGRQLKMEEFEKAFGTVPGHEEDGNFLKGIYKDPADIFSGRLGSPFAVARAIAEHNTIKYADLPKPAKNTERFDESDINFIAYVAKDKTDHSMNVVIYKREVLNIGHGYVKIIDKNYSLTKASFGHAMHEGDSRDGAVFFVVGKTNGPSNVSGELFSDQPDNIKQYSFAPYKDPQATIHHNHRAGKNSQDRRPPFAAP